MSEERLSVPCPNCAARLRIPAAAAGKRVRCPKCQATVAIPAAPATAEAPADDLLEQLGQGTALESPEERRARQAAPRPRPKPVAASRAPDADAPRGPRIDWGTRLVAFMAAYARRDVGGYLCLLSLLLGGLIIFLAVKETRIRERWQWEPQTITCEQLAARGPGDNLHVELTDFVLLPDYIYRHSLAGWEGAWVPAAAPSAIGDALAAHLEIDREQLANLSPDERDEALDALDVADIYFNVIVSFPKATGPAYLEQMADEPVLEGAVLNGFTSLDGEQQRLLREGYPDTDFNRVWIMVAGRQAHTMGAVRLQILGGIVLILFSLALAFWRSGRLAADAAASD